MEAEMAWAAGIFEGEGSVYARQRHNGRYQGVLRIQMTDRDVLERFAAIMGFGKVNGPYQRPGKDMYVWEVGGWDKVEWAFAFFEPWLCARRTEQFKRAIAQKPREESAWPVTV